MPAWITTFLAIAGGVATLCGAVIAVKQAIPIVQTIVGVFGDLAGTPARPGVEARPGVIESLANIKATQDAQGVQLAELKDTLTEQGRELAGVKHELHPNSGLSLRDSMDRVEEHLGIGPNAPKAPVKTRKPRRPRTKAAAPATVTP